MSLKPPTLVDLVWDQELRFKVAFDAPSSTFPSLMLDSAGHAGPSPVQCLAAALAGCMAMDLVHILTRGRHTIRDLTARLAAERADEQPRRLVRAQLHFVVDSDAPDEAIERALTLSREKYCSVWQSLRHDIEFDVTFARD